MGATELGEWSNASNAPDLFALAGMGAFFCGVARVPITATVIVFEITRDFNLLFAIAYDDDGRHIQSAKKSMRVLSTIAFMSGTELLVLRYQ